jgi:hypothetical protein
VRDAAAPASRTRSAPAAFGRGVSQVVANPRLLLAPLAFGGAVAAAFVAVGACVVLLAGSEFAARSSWRRGPAAFSDFFEGLQAFLFASPGAVLIALLGLLVVLLLLTALAAWIRAGVTGTLADVDARTAENAPLAAFRHPSLGAAFFGSASRLFGPFFALVNLYALVASFVFLLIVAPLVGAFVAAASRRTGLMIFFGLLFAIFALVSIVVSIAMRVIYLVAGRTIAVEGLDALAATGRAIALVKESLGRSLTLYFLTVGGALAVGLAFVFPRIVLTFVASFAHAGAVGLVVVSGFFILLQVGAGLAYDLCVTGSFVALWPAEGAPAGPADPSAVTAPYAPSTAPEPPAP